MKVLLVVSAVILGALAQDSNSYSQYQPYPYYESRSPYQTRAPYNPTSAPYNPTPAPYKPTSAPYNPTPQPTTYNPPTTYQPDSYKPYCPANETYEYCKPLGFQYCNDKFELYGMKCFKEAEGCYCKFGYYRNDDGDCVKAEDCCKNEYEQYYYCKPGKVYCGDHFDFRAIFCLERGCFCEHGYLRDEYGKCVPEYQCSSYNSQEY